MKQRINKIILTSILLISSFVFLPNVFADEIVSRTDITIDGKTVYKIYDNKVTGNTNLIGATGAKLKVSADGVIYDGYCIDFGMYITTGTTEAPLDLYEYFRNVLSETEAKELVRKITLYIKFGYGTQGKTDDKYYLATQQLIWQEINDTGFYNSDFYKERAELTQGHDIVNFGWTTDKTTKIDISTELNAIKNDVNTYYTKPSFCSSANKIEIETGKTREYTDNNNVLSLYEVTCDSGITCQTDGNKLKVTATDETGSQKITFTKPQSGVDAVIYRASGSQGIIVNKGILESISCEFGIDTFKNEKTADMQMIYIVVLALFCGTMAYITYYTKKSLDGLN